MGNNSIIITAYHATIFKSSSFPGEISLFEMSNYDSLGLFKKIKELTKNETHNSQLSNKKFSDKEINSCLHT